MAAGGGGEALADRDGEGEGGGEGAAGRFLIAGSGEADGDRDGIRLTGWGLGEVLKQMGHVRERETFKNEHKCTIKPCSK